MCRQDADHSTVHVSAQTKHCRTALSVDVHGQRAEHSIVQVHKGSIVTQHSIPMCADRELMLSCVSDGIQTSKSKGVQWSPQSVQSSQPDFKSMTLLLDWRTEDERIAAARRFKLKSSAISIALCARRKSARTFA